jgi:hypothetical protein
MCSEPDCAYGPDHVKAHFHAALCVVGARFRQSRDAVVAVAQQLDPQTLALLGIGWRRLMDAL